VRNTRLKSDVGRYVSQVVHHPDDADRLSDPLFGVLARRAESLASELRGDHVYSGASLGYPTRSSSGHCRICGRYDKLTYEHIPPRSTGNRTTRRFASAFEILNAPVITQFPKTGVVIQQRGSGFYLLCGDCNSLLSNLGYVDEYRELVGATAQAMVDYVAQQPDEDVFTGSVALNVQNLRPGLIVRQALAMIMCASGSARFSDLFPDLRDCVLAGTPTALPLGMSLHLAVAVGPRGRLVYPVGAVDHAAGQWQVLMDASFAPLSWVLRVSDSSPDIPPANVSDWTTLDPDRVETIDITTEAGFIFGPMPLDYRHASAFPEAVAADDDGQ
jgi:hypothetical protein